MLRREEKGGDSKITVGGGGEEKGAGRLTCSMALPIAFSFSLIVAVLMVLSWVHRMKISRIRDRMLKMASLTRPSQA